MGMNKGVFTPRRNIENDKGVVLDDHGAVINRGKHTGRLNPDQIVKMYGPEMLPKKYVKDLKQKQEQSEIMNRKQLKPDVRGADIWKSMEKYRTWERNDDVDLDFYRKYHNMAVPRAFPKAMPEAREKWFAWDKIQGFNSPDSGTAKSHSNRADSIPHPLAYDTSIEQESSEAFTPGDSTDNARHPFMSEYVLDKLRISQNSDMLKSSQDIEQSTFNYEQAETSIAREQQGDPNAKNQEQPDVSAE